MQVTSTYWAHSIQQQSRRWNRSKSALLSPTLWIFLAVPVVWFAISPFIACRNLKLNEFDENVGNLSLLYLEGWRGEGETTTTRRPRRRRGKSTAWLLSSKRMRYRNSCRLIGCFFVRTDSWNVIKIEFIFHYKVVNRVIFAMRYRWLVRYLYAGDKSACHARLLGRWFFLRDEKMKWYLFGFWKLISIVSHVWFTA